MIAYLEGKVIKKSIDYIILNVNGVGYKVFTPLSTLCSINNNETVSILVETMLKEDSITLFGFLTEQEREIFTKLIKVSKVGPKLAITILSGLDVEKIISAIQNRDIKLLSSVPGIGKKTAERICFDLKDAFNVKFDTGINTERTYLNIENDIMEALVNLGYKQNEIKDIVKEVIENNKDETLENLLKIVLNKLYNG
jgi:Holliday junction DNA helicase RuvA